jgi:hypothetical protein
MLVVVAALVVMEAQEALVELAVVVTEIQVELLVLQTLVVEQDHLIAVVQA